MLEEIASLKLYIKKNYNNITNGRKITEMS